MTPDHGGPLPLLVPGGRHRPGEKNGGDDLGVRFWPYCDMPATPFNVRSARQTRLNAGEAFDPRLP